MTATLYEITAYLPHPLRTVPPRHQPRVIPVSLINRQALEYWDAATTVRFERRQYSALIYGRPIWAESDLWRLRWSGVLPALKERAREALQEDGVYGLPVGGGAA